jgi:hypothetical protein
MAFPTFVIGPAFGMLGWIRDRHQSRRKVRLTVHRAHQVLVTAARPGQALQTGVENYYVTVTNASRDRDIVVTHVWLDTTPPLQVFDADLPVRPQAQRGVGDHRPRRRRAGGDDGRGVARAVPGEP